MAEQNDRKRCRSEEVDLPEVKKLREDLLEILEDAEICSTTADLDSFIKSFEDEIQEAALPDLGYLLEASDHELGLPPTQVSSDDSHELGECWGFDDQITELHPFDFENANSLGIGDDF